MTTARPVASLDRPWWREKEVIGLLLVILVGHFLRLPDLVLRGEEPRRALVALEMMRTGDWIVPRQQGEPFLSRPPLQNWILALSMWVCGDSDESALRLPSVLAILLTTLLIYGHGRSFLSRLGALGAAVGFATMAEVLTLGRMAETESLFTLLVSASLLVWHRGHERNWPAALTWMAGYGLAALATLAKGPQAPVYFAGAVAAYLLVCKQWRYLLSVGHLAGLATFGIVVGAWLVPFSTQLGWQGVLSMVTGDVGMRFPETTPLQVLGHIALFPLEVFGATAPWSLLLVAYLFKPFRAALGGARPQVLFLMICLAVAFPTCWFAPYSRSRYFMPLYPCLALLTGLVLDRTAGAITGSPLARIRNRFWIICLVLMAAITAVVASGNWLEEHVGLELRQPAPATIAYVVLAAGLAMFIIRQLGSVAGRWGIAVLALGGFMALSNTLAYVNIVGRRSYDALPDVAHARALIPPGEHLVSFGLVHHRFAFYFGEPIPVAPWPQIGSDEVRNVRYFCVHVGANEVPQLPFAWQQLGKVICDRYHRAEFQENVLICKRLSS